MPSELLRPQASLSPQRALEASQQAPNILYQYGSWNVPWPLTLLLNSDAPEKWTVYENLFYTCLRTGDNQAAHKCLQRLMERFGETNERVMGMIGIYQEATAEKPERLEYILKEYEDVVKDQPTNMVIRKRQVALLKTLSRIPEAITALTQLLDVSPIDAEAWAELAELYLTQGAYAQAIFSLEEVLLVVPNAWNMHARLGEALYVSAVDPSAEKSSVAKVLTRSMKQYCRSVELCDNYLRGFYGVKITTRELQKHSSRPSGRETADDDFPMPALTTLQKLNELATSKLAEIIRKYSTGEKGWDGYDEAEIIAARALLDEDVSSAPR